MTGDLDVLAGLLSPVPPLTLHHVKALVVFSCKLGPLAEL